MEIDKIIKFDEFEKIGHNLNSKYQNQINQINENKEDDFFGIIIYEKNLYTSAESLIELVKIMDDIINKIKHDIFENRNSENKNGN